LVVPSAGEAMAERVRARRLSDQEGQRLQRIVRRGKHGSIRVRRAMIIMASASGTPVPAIARLVAALPGMGADRGTRMDGPGRGGLGCLQRLRNARDGVCGSSLGRGTLSCQLTGTLI